MTAGSNQTTIDDLRELLAALARRLPCLGHDREREIARDAAALRRTALERIAQLERSLSGNR